MWTDDFREESERQGWLLVSVDGDGSNLAIQKMDEANIFQSDDEAIGFVNAMASLGSYTALAALRLVPSARRAVDNSLALNDLNWRLCEMELPEEDTAMAAWKALADSQQTSCYCDEGHANAGQVCLLCHWLPLVFIPGEPDETIIKV